MKKGRFLWSAHRITERQKAGKARNIKGKQLKNSRSTVSKQPVAHLSSPRDNVSRTGLFKTPKSLRLRGFPFVLNYFGATFYKSYKSKMDKSIENDLI